MRQAVHLTFEALLALLGHAFEQLPDARNPNQLTF